MTNTEYQNTLKAIESLLVNDMLKDKSEWNGVRYQRLSPVKTLLELIALKGQEDKEYKNKIISWFKQPSTITTRDEICFYFKKAINDKYKDHNKYPLPFENAWEKLDEYNYKRIKK